MAEWYEIRTMWNWWRHNHSYPFWAAVAQTFRSCVFWPLREIYCWIWIKFSDLNWKYNRFGKMYRLKKKIRELEENLFPEDIDKPIQPTGKTGGRV